MEYDVIIIGAGPGGIFSAFELMKKSPETRVAVFEEGNTLEKRKCPIDGKKVKSCIKCPTCAIMNGFGGAGAFSDGKYNITNDFGGTLYEYIGKKSALELMEYVDKINLAFGGEGTKLYSTAGSSLKTRCMQNGLHLLDASVRHLGTDINYIVLEHLYDHLKEKIDFHFNLFLLFSVFLSEVIASAVIFTFQYVSIISASLRFNKLTVKKFTFQYVSIISKT